MGNKKKIQHKSAVERDGLPPYELTDNDPHRKSNRGKSRKYLTNVKKRSILDAVNKLKRKDDKAMTTKKTNTNGKTNALKSLAWLVEASFRGFVGWILLANFNSYLTTAVAVFALVTAGAIVITHFVRANR